MLWNVQLNSFFVEGRHLNVCVFITSQHIKGLGPMIRGNMDLVILQPIYNLDARKELHNLYAGNMDFKDFCGLMDEIVMDENLPGSTPQEPDKRVRTMVVNDYENTIDPSMKFKWWEAEDPGPFRMLHPEYWKEDDNSFGGGGGGEKSTHDPVDELDAVQALQDVRFY